jgi:hypothetical protein
MATYVNDLRLKEIATGDESGTWGTSTNTNLELIAEAFSYATQDCFTTDADATTTIADGATDPARSLYFKVTSSATLTATRTLTLAPNTVSKVWIIENATTGGQSITISQGSGTNVTIINGSTSVIYSDGGGASANIADAFFNLTLTGDLLVDDSTLYVDSSNNRVGIGTTSPTNLLDVENSSGDAVIDVTSGTANLARLNLGDTGGNTRGGLKYDNSNDSMAFRANGSDQMTLTSTGLGIGTTSPAAPLHAYNTGAEIARFEGNDEFAYLGLRGTVSSVATSLGYFGFANDTGTAADLNITNAQNGDISFTANSAERMRIDSSGNVGIGTTSPGGKLTVNETSAGQIIQLSLSGTEIGNLGTVGNDMYVGTGDTTLRFHDSDDDIRPANTTGSARDNEVDLGHAGAAFKDLYLGSGIYLTGTAAANYLDDYEEGAVTLTFRDESGNSTTGASGAYTKIGRTVIFTGEEVNVDVTGLVTTDSITLDLPFTAGGGQTGDSVGATWWQALSNISNPERTIVMTVGDNGTAAGFQQVYTSGTGVSVKVSDLNSGGTSDLRRFCLVYFTST